MKENQLKNLIEELHAKETSRNDSACKTLAGDTRGVEYNRAGASSTSTKRRISRVLETSRTSCNIPTDAGW